MITLVLDQATVKTGFAVLKHGEATLTPSGFIMGKLLAHGIIEAPAKGQMVDRLTVIRSDIRELINTYHPNELVIENTAFFKFPTANALQAVAALCNDLAKEFRIPLYSQTPMSIKKAATGSIKADKIEMIGRACELWAIPRSDIKDDNHADALCAAYRWILKCKEAREKRRLKRAKK